MESLGGRDAYGITYTRSSFESTGPAAAYVRFVVSAGHVRSTNEHRIALHHVRRPSLTVRCAPHNAAVEKVPMRADVETELTTDMDVRLEENVRSDCPFVETRDGALQAHRHEPEVRGRASGRAAAAGGARRVLARDREQPSDRPRLLGARHVHRPVR